MPAKPVTKHWQDLRRVGIEDGMEGDYNPPLYCGYFSILLYDQGYDEGLKMKEEFAHGLCTEREDTELYLDEDWDI
jgi:hypothetical protein